MALQVENVTFAYTKGGRPVLQEVSARFEKDRITVLTGASGCGKSTLLYLMVGIYPNDTGFLRGGQVRLDGENPSAWTPPERCAHVGMMFQNPELQFCMDTVENELIFCLENRQVPPGEIPGRMDGALEFCGISALKKRTLLSLSGGERQKVMLACVTALQSQWLLLDEPFANVDEKSAAEIAGKLRRLHKERGVGIVAVDHRLDHWLAAADEIRVMEEGKIDPQGYPVGSLSPDWLEKKGIVVPGRLYREPLLPRKGGEIALSLRDVSITLGEKPIARELSARFACGQVHALLGESGCGKSTLFGAITGTVPYGGEICAGGYSLKKRRRLPVGLLGLVTQNPQDQFVFDTVYDEVYKSLLAKGEQQAAETAQRILRENQLWRYRELSPYMLSQGQQRRLGVAALTAYDCRVLLCDEPTYAQDRRNTIAILEGLVRQVEEKGLCLIFSTHDRMLAESYADQIWHMEGGKLYAQTGSRV